MSGGLPKGVEAGVTTGLGLNLLVAGEVGTGAGVSGASGGASSSDSCLQTLAKSDNGSPFLAPFALPLPSALANPFGAGVAGVLGVVGTEGISSLSSSSFDALLEMAALLLTGVPKAGAFMLLLGGVCAMGGPLKGNSLWCRLTGGP